MWRHGVILLLSGIIGVTILTVSAQCPNNGVQVQSQCFVFKDTSKSWTDASSDCVTSGGSLADIASNGVQIAIKNKLSSLNVATAWVGGQETAIPWAWNKGGEVLYYQGCYSDSTNNPRFTGMPLIDQNVTPLSCVSRCAASNYNFAGIAMTRDGVPVCHCGSSFDRNSAKVVKNCLTRCSSDQSQYCGGSTSEASTQFQRVYFTKALHKWNRWSDTQPNDIGGNQHCALLDGTQGFKFNDEICNNVLFYLCDIVSSSRAGCLRQGVLYQYANATDRCYYISKRDANSFEDAQNECISKGGSLANIESEQVYDNLMPLIDLTEYGQARFYIGLNNLQWQWKNSVAFSYTAWQPGQPSQGPGRCMAMRKDFTYQWSNEICSDLHPYVCKIVSSIPQPTTKPNIPTTTIQKTTTQAPPTRAPPTTQPPTTQSPSTKLPVTKPTTNSRTASTSASGSATTPTGAATTPTGAATTPSGAATTPSGPSGSTLSSNRPPSTQSQASSTSGTGKGTTKGNTGGSEQPVAAIFSKGVIVAIAVACIAVAAALLRLLVYCACKGRQNKDIDNDKAYDNQLEMKENGGDTSLYAEINRPAKSKHGHDNENGPNMFYAY